MRSHGIFSLNNATDDVQSRQPCRGVNFQHDRGVVAIQHQAGPAIAFPMNQTVAGGRRIKKPRAPRERLRKTRLPPRGVNRLRLARVQNAHPDRRIRIKQTHGEKFVLAVIDHGEVAKLAGAVGFLNAVGKEPRMTGAHDGFRRRRDAQTQAGRRSVLRIHGKVQSAAGVTSL